ncbi:MAG TPA: hypothetical protein VJN18_09135 [Polyangiaceae bacterium]|nr:hypothetical protein [Polyangiaceae bacterium]
MKKSPVAVVRERFQSKEQLVEAVQKLASSDLWLERVSGGKGLAKVSNQKLLRLHDVLSDAKQRFGSRDKLISAILELKKRTKDAGYTAKIKQYALPQLLDLHQSSERQGKRAAAKASPTKPVKKVKVAAAPAAKKAAAKPAATKKASAKKASAKKK